MNLISLQYFLQIAKTENLTKAAEDIHITQPALSRVLAGLEDELGVSLFIRSKKRLILSYEGQILKETCEHIFSDLEELTQRFNDCREGLRGHIRIGSSFPERDPDLVQRCILEFMEAYPDVSIDYHQTGPNSLRELLSERKIDLAISTLPISSPKILWTEIFSERLGILIAKDHPLAKEKSIRIAQLRNERFFCNNANSDNRDITIEFCRKAGFDPQIFFQGFFPELIGKSVSEGKGVSFIIEARFLQDNSRVNYIWKNNLCFRPIEDDYCRRYYGIAYIQDGYCSKATEQFRAFFLNYVQSRIGERIPQQPTSTSSADQ